MHAVQVNRLLGVEGATKSPSCLPLGKHKRISDSPTVPGHLCCRSLQISQLLDRRRRLHRQCRRAVVHEEFRIATFNVAVLNPYL